MNPSHKPLVLCVPCTILTALLAMIVVVLADLQIVDETPHYTRTYTIPCCQHSVQITLVLDQQVRCELLIAPLAAPVSPVSPDERVA